MCGIIGITGNFKAESLINGLNSIKHRGPDFSGIYINSNIDDNKNNDSIKNSELCEYIVMDSDLNNIKDNISCKGLFKEDFNIGLGHNLLSIFNNNNNLNNCNSNDNVPNSCNYQPITHNDLIMVYNGEIYNFNEISSFLNSNKNNKSHILTTDDNNIKGDGDLLINLIQYFLDNNNNWDTTNATTGLLPAVESVKSMINGDYAFAVYDGENLAITRDYIGVKPLYYSKSSCGNFNVFASEKRAITSTGATNIKTLAPGATLYNWELVDSNYNCNYNSEIDFNYDYSYNYEINFMDKFYKNDYENIKEELKSSLINSTISRVSNIGNIGIIFSGGLDSAIIAKILKDNNINVKLFSAGDVASQDLEFSTKIANELDLEIKKCIINEDILKDNLDTVLLAINEYENFYSNTNDINNKGNTNINNSNNIDIIKLGVGMTIYLASKLASENNISVILSGQGADELFAGYDRYRRNYSKYKTADNTKIAITNINKELEYDLNNIANVNLERDDAVSMVNSVDLRVPFLDKNIINLANKIPLGYKIKGEDDLLRKHILRDIAKELGLPEYIYNRPKKAAQYGSGIHKLLIKKVLKSR